MSSQPTKLPRLPKNARISKRPLLHAPIPSPYAGKSAQKVVYVSARTPFISAVKRVRGLLQHADKRTSQSERGRREQKSARRRGGGNSGKRGLGAGAVTRDGKLDGGDGEEGAEEVVVKGSGKAIEKVLQLAVWFQGQEDVKVVLRTGSVGAIDDIEIVEERKGEKQKSKEKNSVEDEVMGEAGEPDRDEEGKDDEVEEGEEEGGMDELPESRIRFTSVVEVGVTLR